MADTSPVQGLKEVVAALDGVEKAVRKKLLRKAATAGGKVVVKEYKSRLKKRSGLLAKSVGHKVKTYEGVAVDVVGARTGMAGDYKGRKEDPAYIAHFVELGTRPHSTAKGAKLARKGKGGKLRGQSVGQDAGRMHPGAKKQPALLPAKRSTGPRVIALMTDVIATGIEAAAKGGA